MVLDNSVQQFNNNKMVLSKKEKVVDLVFIRQLMNAQINSHKHIIESNKESVKDYRFNDNEKMAQWCEGRIAGHKMALKIFEETIENIEKLARHEK